MSYLGTSPAKQIQTNTLGDGTVTPAKLSTGHPTWDSSGNLGVGTSSPQVKLNIYDASVSAISIQGDSSTALNAQRSSTDASGPNLNVRKARGSTASLAAVASGDNLGSVLFQAYGGTNTRNICAVQGYVSTYTSDTDISSYLTFSTSPSGSAANNERMRIDSAGNVGIGTIPPTGTQLSTIQTSYGILGGTNQVNINNNAYYNGGWKYIGTGTATLYAQNISGATGCHVWSTATSGTADAAITFTERMRIDASGNVGIGATPGAKFHVAGGYATLGDYNAGVTGASPIAAGASFSTNITNGQAETDIWNGADPSIYTNTGLLFTQRLTSTTRRDLMFLHNNGNLQFNSGYGSVANAYGCRAWVNFNGTGTVAIRGSGNVSSITDLGVGNYQINFSTVMPDVNYATSYLLAETYSSGNSSRIGTVNQTTGYVQLYAKDGAGTSFDSLNSNIMIFR